MKKILAVALVLAVCLSLLVMVSCNSSSPGPAEAGTASIGIDPPTTYFDGVPLAASDILSYTLLWGNTDGGPYPNSLNVGKVSTASIPNLKTGTYYIVATALTTSTAGLQVSGYSNQLTKQIYGVPMPPVIH